MQVLFISYIYFLFFFTFRRLLSEATGISLVSLAQTANVDLHLQFHKVSQMNEITLSVLIFNLLVTSQ